MNQVRQGLDNQAIGLLPLLLFMFLDNFFSYKISFSIAALFCLLSFLAYHLLKQGRVYQFMLLPTAATFICYSGFLLMHLEPVLFTYSPLIAELLLVVVLAVSGLTKTVCSAPFGCRKCPSTNGLRCVHPSTNTFSWPR